MPLQITFKKSGKEIREAIGSRISQIESRLKKRNSDLSQFMEDQTKLRSYLVRSAELPWMSHARNDRPAPLFSEEDISSEEQQEIAQLCRRIYEIEQELNRLKLIREHLKDNQEFDLSYQDLVGYGFEAKMFVD